MGVPLPQTLRSGSIPAADGTTRIGGEPYAAKLHVYRVNQEQAAVQGFTDTGQYLERLGGLDAANDAYDRGEYSVSRAGLG